MIPEDHGIRLFVSPTMIQPLHAAAILIGLPVRLVTCTYPWMRLPLAGTVVSARMTRAVTCADVPLPAARVREAQPGTHSKTQATAAVRSLRP